MRIRFPTKPAPFHRPRRRSKVAAETAAAEVHVVFTTSAPTNDPVRQADLREASERWKTLTPFYYKFNDTATNEYGAPFLGDMFETAFRKHGGAATYTYVNADILMDETWPATIDAVVRAARSHRLARRSDRFLVVGSRYDVVYRERTPVRPRTTYQWSILDEYGRRKYALDWFTITRDTFDWTHEIPQIVIGRRGYDQWLMDYALRNRSDDVAVVDATATARATHFNGRDGSSAWKHHDDAADREYNMRILGRGWNEAIDPGDAAYRTRFGSSSSGGGSSSSEEDGGRNGGEEEDFVVVERVPEGPARSWWWW
eukprot:g3999.t1